MKYPHGSYQQSPHNIFLKQPPELFCKKKALKNLQISQENYCVGVFLIKLNARRPATLSKRDSNTAVFL